MARTDYSGIVYDPISKQMLLFGGGHGPAVATDIVAFPMAALPSPWVSLYPSTPAAAMVPENEDNVLWRWISTNQPVVRHTYNACLMIGHKFYMMTAYTGTFCWYDLDRKVWSWTKTGTPPWADSSASALDPQSGKIVIVGTDPQASGWIQVWLYDPVADSVQHCGWTGGIGRLFDLHYLAERDVFVALQPSGDVWEIMLNRFAPKNTKSVKIATTGAPAVVDMMPAAWARNPASDVLLGCIGNGIAQNFNLTTHVWSPLHLKNEDGSSARMTQAFYCIEFDPDSGCFIFLARDGNTYAYRP